ncbi:MAG TPA: hypothetical protein VKW04_18830 [Planctomycetota bacterium]|nr:hypothetical protein [Planctomycetota bacterium]
MHLVLLALLVGLGPLASFTQEPSRETADRFAKALKNLGADDYQDREAASAEINALPADALALIEAELNKADLEAEVRSRLERSLSLFRVKAKKTASARKKAASMEWTQKTVVAAYEEVGRKDAKWDAKVREALPLVALSWEASATIAQSKRAFDLTGEAMDAGCDDPIVAYAHARMYGSTLRKDPAEEARLHVDAAKAMKARGARYHEIRQAFCFARAAEMLSRSKKTLADEDQQQIGEWLELALSRLGEGSADAGVPETLLRDIADSMTGTGMILTRDRKVWFQKVFDALTKARPESPVPLLVKGRVYTDYAWDARGQGYANTVTPDGWKRMADRLSEAEKALTAAWKLRPDDPEAPTQMLVVELGQGRGRQVMETWYQRAMRADPDNREAVRKKMYYLEPKWHGSAEAMLAFGRELLAGGNWDASLPYELVSAHLTLAGYEDSPDAYYKNDAVWQDVKAVYDRALKRAPEATRDRSYFAKLACWCGHWKEAKAQFDRLGERVDVQVFADADEMNRLRSEAAEKGK